MSLFLSRGLKLLKHSWAVDQTVVFVALRGTFESPVWRCLALSLFWLFFLHLFHLNKEILFFCCFFWQETGRLLVLILLIDGGEAFLDLGAFHKVAVNSQVTFRYVWAYNIVKGHSYFYLSAYHLKYSYFVSYFVRN